MNVNDPTPPSRPEDGAPADAEKDSSGGKRLPWVSALVIAVCVGITFCLAQKRLSLLQVGYLPADEIWNGKWWALATSAFVHQAWWHVAFNMYWMWVLGSKMEKAVGSWRFLLFFLLSASIGSSFQLAFSDTTGIGASGAVYAIFGFMWVARRRYPEFAQVLDPRRSLLFILWLAGCVVATWLKVWEVGNAAHVSGLLFGAAIACVFVVRYRPPVMRVGLAALVLCSIVPLIWCPWSTTWVGVKAYNAHVAGHHAAALDRYTQLIRMDPQNAWAHMNRGKVFESLGEPAKAEADYQAARKIDPAMAESK